MCVPSDIWRQNQLAAGTKPGFFAVRGAFPAFKLVAQQLTPSFFTFFCRCWVLLTDGTGGVCAAPAMLAVAVNGVCGMATAAAP